MHDLKFNENPKNKHVEYTNVIMFTQTEYLTSSKTLHLRVPFALPGETLTS